MKNGLIVLVASILGAQDAPNLFSLEKEAKMGASYAAEVRRQYRPLDNLIVNGYVQALGDRITAQIAEPTFPYRFEVLEDNAKEPMSLPGGYVFISAGTLLEVREEAELAGLLAHAIAHVERRHSTRAATRGQQQNLASIPLIFMGGLSGTHDAALMPAAFRDIHAAQEVEADRRGVELAYTAGFDPAGLLRYLERAQPGSQRIDVIRSAVAALQPRTYSAADARLQRIQQELRTSAPAFRQRPAPTLRR
jgi:predicted Zn-dependent protease